MITYILSTLPAHPDAIIAGGVIGIAAMFSDGWINLQGMTLTAAIITLAVECQVVMVGFNALIGAVFAALMLAGYLWFLLTKSQRDNAPHDAMLQGE